MPGLRHIYDDADLAPGDYRQAEAPASTLALADSVRAILPDGWTLTTSATRERDEWDPDRILVAPSLRFAHVDGAVATWEQDEVESWAHHEPDTWAAEFVAALESTRERWAELHGILSAAGPTGLHVAAIPAHLHGVLIGESGRGVRHMLALGVHALRA